MAQIYPTKPSRGAKHPTRADRLRLPRVVRRTDPKAMPGWSAQGYRVAAAWNLAPVAKTERDAKFLGPGSERHCQAVLPGKRCTRFAIRETGNCLCLRHAGPTAARLYRENCRKLVESGRYPWDKWLKEEAQRARTRTRNYQACKPGGWPAPA
jgi:hypothetical protein